jgi:16S rRNA A1518/A1519 N6-dimethyltransferase RsmA/KsgA/DIM1 with predicted DNA glycosylase/AP lyase activity
LPHRTQIVHELDSSMIIHYLDIGPNMTVCESGTGSGAMSHAILRSIAPRGMLHTYEFNGMRAKRARLEFEGHGLGHLVEVHHRDVCGKKKKKKKKKRRKRKEEEEEKVATPLGLMKKKRRMMGETTAGDDDGADDSDDIDDERPD